MHSSVGLEDICRWWRGKVGKEWRWWQWQWKRKKGSGVDWSRERQGRNSGNKEGGGEVMG